MTTMTRTRTSTPWMVLIVAVALSLMSAAQSVPQHALDRHGQDAIRAHEAVAGLGHGGQWRCPDGKEYRIAHIDGAEWAVEILYDGVVATAFVTRDRGYLQRVVEEDGCKATWQGGHP